MPKEPQAYRQALPLHWVKEQNCLGGQPYLLKPSSLPCYPTTKESARGQGQDVKDISGSPWPVASVLRPPKAQELLRDLGVCLCVHCWHLEDGGPCRPLTAVYEAMTSHSPPHHWGCWEDIL